MTLPKEATCKYNSNRQAYKIAYPYCTWKLPDNIVFPDGVFLKRNQCDCKKCKVYVDYREENNSIEDIDDKFLNNLNIVKQNTGDYYYYPEFNLDSKNLNIYYNLGKKINKKNFLYIVFNIGIKIGINLQKKLCLNKLIKKRKKKHLTTL